MRYAVLSGGKRLRPLLVYCAAQIDAPDLSPADPAAAAVELIHAYSLIHDDLPAMDDDDLRRGKPTCHVAFGEAIAILAGDALQALSFELLARPDPQIAPATQLHMLCVLAQSCGAGGMAGGQAVDLESTGTTLSEDGLRHMHGLKTGALFRASVRLGLYAQGHTDPAWHAAADRYAAHFGLAFQIHDDVLDVTGQTDVIGKPVGSDASGDKCTYASMLGIAQARRLARQEADAAIAALSPLHADCAGLIELAHYAVQRDR